MLNMKINGQIIFFSICNLYAWGLVQRYLINPDGMSISFILVNAIIFFFQFKPTSSKGIFWIVIFITCLTVSTIISAFFSFYIINQPLLNALRQLSTELYILYPLNLILMMKRKRTDIESILQSTYYSSIIVLFYFLFIYLFQDPSNYIDTRVANFNPLKSDDYYFNFSYTPLLLLIVFWLLAPLKRELKPSRKKPWIAVFAFISFLFILFANKYRSAILTNLFVIICILIFLNFRKGRKWILIPILLAIPFFLILMKLGYFGPAFSELYVGISGILDNNTTNSIDGSINYRKIQADTALRYIGKSPLFGIGAVDFLEWRTFSDPAFDNFYVSDLGLLGHIFAKGIIGTIIRLFPLFYILRSGFNRFKSFTYQEAICFFMSLGSYIRFSYGGISHETFFFVTLFIYLSLENYKHQSNQG